VRPASRLLTSVTTLVGAGVLLAAAQVPRPTPARLTSAALPPLPPLVTGGGEVLLEVDVTREGRAGAATVLRATPPFTDLMIAAVRQWMFEPATVVKPPAEPDGKPAVETAPSGVLVAGVFRPPTITGPTIGELPKDVAAPSRVIPFPLNLRTPPWPPLAVSGGVVLVEARVDGEGTVTDARITQGARGFDSAALDTVRAWSFRPVRSLDAPEHSFVYVVMGFPVPVTLNDKK
jgi:TonB family protein